MRGRARTLVTVMVVLCVPSTPARAAVIDGSAGADRFLGTPSADEMTGATEDDILSGGGGNDRIDGGADDDILFLGPGRDVALGGSENDSIFDDDGGDRRDVIDAGLGDDTVLSVDDASDRIDCGDGDDVAVVDRADIVEGCEYVAERRGECVEGSAARRLTLGTTRSDDVSASSPVFLALYAGADTAALGVGDDVVMVGRGVDSVNSSSGADLLVDDDGKPGDVLNASTGDGDRIFSVDGAADMVICGPGSGDIAVIDIADDTSGCESPIVFSPWK